MGVGEDAADAAADAVSIDDVSIMAGGPCAASPPAVGVGIGCVPGWRELDDPSLGVSRGVSLGVRGDATPLLMADVESFSGRVRCAKGGGSSTRTPPSRGTPSAAGGSGGGCGGCVCRG